jgi:NodT family efflux transporter outer membrane factor (OMF) lipoprotein
MLKIDHPRQVVRRKCPALLSAPLFASALLALQGCTVGPDFKRPEASIQSEWSAQGDPRVTTTSAANSQWWKTFNDAALDRLVVLAYQQNLPLQIAGLKIMEARAQLGQLTGQQYPQLQFLSAGATAEGLTKQQAEALLLRRNFFNYQLGFDAAWELDFWGKYRRGVEAGAASLVASVADYDSALVSLTAEVARTYAVIRTFQVLIAEAEANVKLQETGQQIATARFQNGATSELDVTQATALLESTRASIPQLQTSERQARNALSTLLGQPTGTVDGLLAGPQQIPQGPAQVALSMPANMLRRRPDIRSAELMAAAQCARIGVAKAELYPSFSLLGTVGLSANNIGPGAHNPFSPDSVFYSVGPRIIWPFFNYGRLTNGVRVEDARFQQTLVNYRNTVLKAAQEVEDALVGFLKAQEAALAQQGSVTAAQRSQEIALVQYREGATDFQRVVDSQRFLLQQQNALTQTQSSVTTNLIALYKALGGGWELREGHPFVPASTQKQMKERTDWGDLLTEPRKPETKPNPVPVKQ